MAKPRAAIDDLISQFLDVLQSRVDFTLAKEHLLSVVELLSDSAQTISIGADLLQTDYRIGGYTVFNSDSGLQHVFSPASGVSLNGAGDDVTLPADFSGGAITLYRTGINEYLLQYGNAGAAGGQVDSVVAGTNVTVDDTDPANPIVSASGGSFSGCSLRNTSQSLNHTALY